MEKPTKIEVVGLVANRSLDRSGKAILKKVEKFLIKQKKKISYNNHAANYLDKKRTAKDVIMRKSDFVITFGGDGTLIRIARHVDYKIVPILAINLGSVGFLTEVQRNQKITDVLKRIFVDDKYKLDIRSMLRATIYRKGKKIETFLALNEAVINQGNFARLIELTAHINQRKMIRFKADGMIVATPTGSTGHSLSAGGPIVHPQLDAFVFTPICPSKLSIRPIVIPSNRQLTITIETKRRFEKHDLSLTIDGQIVTQIKYGDQIKFRRSTRHFILARLTNTRYYKVLREKLGWGD
jgi:NAD+ kinase